MADFQIKNTNEKFGIPAKFFHWAVGIIVLLMLPMGFWMTGLGFSPFKLSIYMVHKSFGIMVLALMIGRLAWRLAMGRPDKLPTHKEWEDKLAKIAHVALYVCLFIMPLDGWVMSSAGGFPATFFGLFSLPVLMAKNATVFAITRNIHTFTAYAILGLLALHFAGAFKHHFIDKDATLKRMASYKVGLKLGILFAVVAGFFWIKAAWLAVDDGSGRPAAGAAATQTAPIEATQTEGWIIDPVNSSIGFEAKQYKEPFSGQFRSFGGKIIFDAEHLDDAYADIWIDITSIDTGSPDRDGQARSPEWFDTANFPKAMFVADDFVQTGPNQYVAKGALTIHGKPMMIELPFSLETRRENGKDFALMQSKITLDRHDYAVGTGQWLADDVIGGEIHIFISLEASK